MAIPIGPSGGSSAQNSGTIAALLAARAQQGSGDPLGQPFNPQQIQQNLLNMSGSPVNEANMGFPHGGGELPPSFPASGPNPLVALHNVAAPSAQQTSTSGDGGLGSLLNLLGYGASPTQVSNPNPAPTMADFWNASPYNAELAALTQAGHTGAAATKAAYAQAIAQQGAYNKLFSSQAASQVGQAQQMANSEMGMGNSAVSAASAQMAPGAAAATGLTGMQGILNQDAERGVQNAKFFQGLLGEDNTANMQQLGTAQAGALGSLQSQIAAAQGKIGSAENTQYSAAQRAFQQALSSWNNQNFTAQVDNAKAKQDQGTANANAIKALVSIQNQQNPSLTSKTAVINALNNPTTSGLPAQVATAGQSVLNGFNSTTQTAANGRTITVPSYWVGAPKSPTEASKRLADSVSQGQITSAQANQLQQLIDEYFSGNTKASPIGGSQPDTIAQIIAAAQQANSGLTSA